MDKQQKKSSSSSPPSDPHLLAKEITDDERFHEEISEFLEHHRFTSLATLRGLRPGFLQPILVSAPQDDLSLGAKSVLIEYAEARAAAVAARAALGVTPPVAAIVKGDRGLAAKSEAIMESQQRSGFWMIVRQCMETLTLTQHEPPQEDSHLPLPSPPSPSAPQYMPPEDITTSVNTTTKPNTLRRRTTRQEV